MQENVNGGPGDNGKYKRMDADATEEDIVLSNNDQQQEGIVIENRDTTKYVFACAIFASLNSVLLGYG